MTSSSDDDTSKVDFYEFLGLSGPAATDSEIKRAGRKTSLLYHPDKVAPTPENLQNFHILQIVIGVLSDPAEKTKYDQTREAKLRRKAEVDALDEKRRKMVDDLEDRERGKPNNVVAGQKRTFSEREMKIRRAQEESRKKMDEINARKRLEKEQMAARERVQTVKSNNNDSSDKGLPESPKGGAIQSGGDNVDSLGRSIKLRWTQETDVLAYEESTISDFFPSGNVENVIMLKPKKRKVEGRKVLLYTAVVIFTTLRAAKAALDAKGRLAEFESVEWAEKREAA